MSAPIRSGALPPPEGLLWIAVDFDNTLAECHFDLETGINHIGDAIPGALAKCQELADHGYKIIIHTSRPWWDYEAIEEWLNGHGFPYSRIVCGKLMARAYVDDRNIAVNRESWLPRETEQQNCQPYAALLGKRVEVTLDRGAPHIITIGKLLAWDNFGECMVETDNGEVVYCWPMLTVRPT